MNIEALHPYVAPHVVGCPIPVMDHNIRLSAIEFCDKTRWHEEIVAATRQGEDGVYELDVDTGHEVSRITSVAVNGKRIDPETKATGLRLIEAASTAAFFVVLDSTQIQINPAPSSTDAVQVIAALRPTMTATSINDALSEWREAIAGGAIARIAAIPKQDFTNLDLAAYHRGIFNSAVQTALVKQGFGSSESRASRQVQTF